MVFLRLYWFDPMWRGLRIVTLVTATATIVILVAYLAGEKSWLVALTVAVVANVGFNLALVIRSLIVRAKKRNSSGT
jgi:hypothetical protein